VRQSHWFDFLTLELTASLCVLFFSLESVGFFFVSGSNCHKSQIKHSFHDMQTKGKEALKSGRPQEERLLAIKCKGM